jgi:hypothetical protein
MCLKIKQNKNPRKQGAMNGMELETRLKELG